MAVVLLLLTRLGGGQPSAAPESAYAPGTFPDYVMAAPATVREAYQFAVDHPEVLRYIPCSCGCVRDGHKSNLDCYIDARNDDGSVVYDSMGVG